MKTEPADLMIAPASDRLLSPDELSEYLGIPVQTIYQWRHRGLGPRGHRIGRHVRFRWADVQEWLATRADDAPGKLRGAPERHAREASIRAGGGPARTVPGRRGAVAGPSQVGKQPLTAQVDDNRVTLKIPV